MSYDDVFVGTGEVAAHLRALDWSRCPIGTPDRWSSTWRTAMRMMLDTATPMCMCLGRDELLYFLNDAYIPIVAGKYPACLARPVSEVWSEIWDEIEPQVDALLATGTPLAQTDRPFSISRHGRLEESYFSVTFNGLRDDHGKIVGIHVISVETTARVLAERRLACLRELAQQAFEAETPEQACERAAEVLSRAADVPAAVLYVVDEAGKSARRVAHAGSAGGGAFEAAPIIDLEHGRDPLGVAEAVRAGVAVPLSGLERFASLRLAGVRDGFMVPIVERLGDRIAGVLVAAATPLRPVEEARDFLELVSAQLATALGNARAKQYAQERVEALAALDRAKTTFFNDVSHELRTPLTLLLGPLTEVLSGGRMGEEDRALLSLAQRGAWRMKKLVRTLLDFARVEAGRAEPCFEPVDLAAYTEELASMFRSAFESAELGFVVDAQPMAQRAFVDREMWEQIVHNLLSNALKFTRQGEVRVHLSGEGEHARLEVSDTGTGIAAEHLPRLFDRFYRVQSAWARTREGTGIGLSLVRELVRLHGGRVAVASQLGRSTTVAVSVPLGSAHLPAEQIRPACDAEPSFAQLHREEALGWLEEAPPPLASRALSSRPEPRARSEHALRKDEHRPRVLLAEDDPDMRAYLRRILSEHWELLLVGDGMSALQRARTEWPDLIVSDVMMPGLGGFELLDAIRRDKATHDIPVILVSARAGEEATEHALRAGAADYVVKPFSARELVARIATQLAHVRRELAERTARELAEQTGRAREQFLAMLAHELRSPLSVILGWVELMQQDALGSEDAPHALSTIEQSGKLMQRLVEDLLDTSRSMAGTLTLHETRIANIAPQLESVIASHRRSARDKGVRLEATIEPEAGPLVGDAQRIQQVLTNLLGNALKFTPPGGAISVTCVRGAGELELSVSDTGTGISADALAHVFEQYWMGDRNAGRSGGLGLGLAIVRSIVELHGGTIVASSEGPSRGARFVVRLPLAAR